MRRLVFLCALAVIAVAYSPQRTAPAQSDATQLDSSLGLANAPVIVATGVKARSLAVLPHTLTSENDGNNSVYLTIADKPNQLFELSFAIDSAHLTASGPLPRLAPFAGVSGAGSLGDGGAAIAAELNLKLDSLLIRSGVAVASDGTVFIADTLNSTIRRIAGPASTEPGIIRSIMGRWAPRQDIDLVEPVGIAVDHTGNLYVADHAANQILLIHAATSQTPGPVEVLAHVTQPSSLSSTSDGWKIFVASVENEAVFAVDVETREIQTVAGLVGQPSACPGSVLPKSQTEICPTGLAVDGAGDLFIADVAANHIIRVDAKTSAVTVAVPRLVAPGEIKFDATGDLFVVEQGRDSIVELRKLGQPVNSVTLSPASNDFGVEPTGGTSPTAPFALANGTNATLTNLVVNNFQGVNPGDFKTLSSSCTTTLAPNSSCTINVAFTPNAIAARSAQLVVSYAGASNLTADLAGVGADYQLALAGMNVNNSVTVIAGNTATYNLQLNPDSNFPTNSPYTVTFVSPPIATPTSSTVPAGDLPALTSPAFTPPSVMVTPGTVVPVTLTIETTSRITGVLGSAPPSFGGKPRDPGLRPLFPAFVLIAAVGVFLCARTFASRNTKRLCLCTIALLFLVAVGLIGGCGGGKKHPIIGTQPGTTNFLVQATVQNAQGVSLNVSRGIPLQLVVQ